MSAQTIGEIVKPVLYRLCDYYTFRKAGCEVGHDTAVSEIRALFANVKHRVEQDEYLRSEYMQIEKPLVFFADYIFKESGFSFSREYEPMAYAYNELSGDDKFFDLLDDCLKDGNSSKDLIEIYYMMMGLGFDGAYRREPKEVENRMYNCAQMLGDMVHPESEVLFPELTEKNYEDKKNSAKSPAAFVKKNIVWIMTGILAGAFIFNLISIVLNTSSYRENVEQTLQAASPYKNMVADHEKDLKDQEINQTAAGKNPDGDGSYDKIDRY